MKMKMVIMGLVAMVAMGVCQAVGNSAMVSWTPPTTWADGTLLSPTDIGGYLIRWDTGSVKAGGSATSIEIPACGNMNFTIVVISSATAKYPNVSSSPVGPLPYASGVNCAPNPVTGAKVS